MNLNLLNYNNYFNRQVKKFDTLLEYEPFILATVENLNFNPGDGINTTQIVNYDGNVNPNYVIISEGTNIISRWFIIDSDFVRRGQVNLTLHRDVIVDNLEAIKNAPVFIEKAQLDDDDPAIFNNEDMTFNQIKQSETPLTDETKCPWIVGYIPSNAFDKDTRVNSAFVSPGEFDIEVPDITKWDWYRFTNLDQTQDFAKTMFENFTIKYYTEAASTEDKDHFRSRGVVLYDSNFKVRANKDEVFTDVSNREKIYQNGNPPLVFYSDGTNQSIDVSKLNKLTLRRYGYAGDNVPYHDLFSQEVGFLQTNVQAKKAQLKNAVNNHFDTTLHAEFGNAGFKNLNGKKIKDAATGKIYKINVKSKTYSNETEDFNGVLGNLIKPCYNIPEHDIYHGHYFAGGAATSDSGTGFSKITATYSGTLYEMELVQELINIHTVITKDSSRTHLVDAPYDMFCMPYKENFPIVNDEGNTILNKSFAAINMAVSIGAATAKTYDVQLLPYCPIRDAIKPDGTFNLAGINADAITSEDGNTIYSYVIWCDNSNFTFDIQHNITITNKKMSNECDLYRLCSPNYASLFEFSPAKNNGVSKFNVDATYKPFNPYIHVNPDFKGLYGADFNDNRGLILAGDFSITQLNNEFAQFEMRNKNYEASFQREIQSLDFNNAIAHKQDEINAAFGTAQATLLGGYAGGSIGGKLGIATGFAGAAAAGSIAKKAGEADVRYNQMLRDEAKNLKIDLFNYQLGNIKAIPYAIAKTTALTANNKLYPFVEYYTCTDMEKEALRNKIEYNGMTVMRIGKINDFIKSTPTFIKGQLIRLVIDDDFHMINTIADELNKGIFI